MKLWKQHLIDVCVVVREVEVQTQYAGHSCNHGEQHFFPIALRKVNLMMSKKSRH